MADWLEDTVLPTGQLMWVHYFEYDVEATGTFHRIMSPESKYDAPLSLAVVQDRWGT
jgi:hypothetical protein